MNARMTPDGTEAVRRALAHHETTGMLYLASEQPTGSGHAWKVSIDQLHEPLFLSWREAYVFSVALAHAERHAQRERE